MCKGQDGASLKNVAVILASGSGTRYESEIPKQFVKIAGKTMLEHTIDIFEKHNAIDEIIVVITPEYRYFAEELLMKCSYQKITALVSGGETRKESSSIGVNAITHDDANVLIHDCARPFLSSSIIDACLAALDEHDAVDVAIPSADTIIKVDGGYIDSIPRRGDLLRGQTPQCFKLSLIRKAHLLSADDDDFTDDCGLVVKHGLAKVFVVPGDVDNIKITYPSDIFEADRLFQSRRVSCDACTPLDMLRDKVIVIFGGTSGIGLKIAERAQRHYALVYTCSSSSGCDVSSYNDVESFLYKVYREQKRIDYVINTAGTLRIGKLADRKIDDIARDIAVNYLGSINTAKAAIPYLKETNGMLLLFASSSYTRGRALYATYSSTKAGIVNLTQALAEELYADGIRVNVINPERTNTPMRTKAFGKEPMNSLLSADVVADASLHTLLSDMTGQVIDVKRSN